MRPKSYYDAKNRDKALRTQEEVVALCRKVLHSDTLLEVASLAYFYVFAGRSGDAEPLLEELNVAPNRSSLLCLKLASLHAWLGREAEYTAVCRQAIQMASESTVPSEVERAARSCCIHPSADLGFLADALSLARRAVQLGMHGPDLAWKHMALGMADYRNGNFEASDKAMVAAETATHQSSTDHPRIQITAQFYRAMSLFRQGKEGAARELFAAIEPTMKPLPAEGQPFPETADQDELIIWMSYKEARALLRQ